MVSFPWEAKVPVGQGGGTGEEACE
jgi:hypothetical protein